MLTDSKFALRQTFREIRKTISTAYREQAALAAAALFNPLLNLKHCQHIACYLSFKDEFETSPLIESIWQAKKQCYLPVLSKDNEKLLHFVHYKYGDALHLNRYSILEPVNSAPIISPEQLDIVITPLIAFDNQGHRLGTGGGYYDRTFAFLHSTVEKPPQLIGLAYAAQQANRLPFDPWDILLDSIVTEKEVIKRVK